MAQNASTVEKTIHLFGLLISIRRIMIEHERSFAFRALLILVEISKSKPSQPIAWHR